MHDSFSDTAQLASGWHWTNSCAALDPDFCSYQFGGWAGQLGDGRAALLGELSPPPDHGPCRVGIDNWLLRYSECLSHISRGLAADLMLKTSSKYMLRNHLGELAIQAAKNKDFSVVAQLQQALEQRFDEQPELELFADLPPEWASGISTSCSS